MALKKWMVRQNMSAESLAKAIGVSRQAVYAWISGEYPPSTSNLARLSVLSGGEITVRDFVDVSTAHIEGVRANA